MGISLENRRTKGRTFAAASPLTRARGSLLQAHQKSVLTDAFGSIVGICPAEEETMANKDQKKRGNREAKKPKNEKPKKAIPVSAFSSPSKGSPSGPAGGKR